jgi:ribosomal-protein-alanine N-acetyltransferase
MSIEPAAYGSHHWSRQSFVTELTNERGFYFGAVCEQTGKLLGYTGYWLIGDEAHITTLAVHPQFRRLNIAERLLINSIIESRRTSAHWMTLEVRVSNEPAKTLYTKYGFQNIGVRRRYYQDNSEDALVLWTDRLTDSTFVGLLKERMAALKITFSGLDALFLGAGGLPASQPAHLISQPANISVQPPYISQSAADQAGNEPSDTRASSVKEFHIAERATA